MHDPAFDILGIAPTTDGRAIRAAFLRLARIYHPDRFSGMPDDVRAEAERRMKDATVAYESLRPARRPPQQSEPVVTDEELSERTRAYRAAMETKRAEEAQNRVRWRRWDEIERRARERAELDAQIAATIAREVGGPAPNVGRPPEPRSEPTSNGARSRPPGSAFERRVDAARRGEIAPLAKRPE